MSAHDETNPGHTHANAPPRRRGRRARGAVRSALIDAGVELARSGGPDAVVLREVTRMVGVVPNAAYRHFADRDELLAAVRDAALSQLAQRMAEGMNRVRAGADTPTGAGLRLRAVGKAYLDFARREPGLFDTAYAATEHPTAGANGEASPFDHLRTALDGLVRAGLLDTARRPDIEYPTWATVHGLATLLRGPLRSLSDREKSRLEAETLAFIGAALAERAE
ncbi:MAG TPA: TetR/AcrR family transcriptional regulator [Solirubrobacteraceae bacterium]